MPPSVDPGIPRLPPVPPHGWSRYRVGDLFERVERPVVLEDDRAYQLVVARRSRGGIEARARLRGSQIKVKQQFRVHADDFLMSNRQISHGGCGIVPPALDGAIVSGEYTVLRPKGGLSLAYLQHLIHSRYFQQICFHSSVGVHVEKLVFRPDVWMAWPIDLPDRTTQERIAAILSDCDRAIADTEALIAAKKREMSALLTRVFEPARRPALDGWMMWKRQPLSELARIVGGATPDTSKLEYWGGDVHWCTPTDLTKLVTRWLDSTERSLTTAGLQACSAELLPPGSILLCSRASVGACAINRVPVATNQGFQSLVPKDPEDSLFLYFLVSAITRRLLRISAGSTFLEFPAGELSKLLVAAPKPDERRLIGRTFATMADEIDLLVGQANAFRCQKRGLMQKLLTGTRAVDADAPGLAAE
jgi:type I restriction enzyme S subunit